MKNLDWRLHTFAWGLYALLCYGWNLWNHPETRFLQIFAAVPLLALVFYGGYALAERLHRFRRRKKWLLLCVMVSPLALGVSYVWIYHLMPFLSIHIVYDYGYGVGTFVQNTIPVFLRYTLYGMLWYMLTQLGNTQMLDAKLRLFQVLPHTVFNTWNAILMRMKPYNISFADNKYIQGQVALHGYAARLPEFVHDLVQLDLELAKVRSWVESLDVHITLTVEGDTAKRVVQPFSLFAVVENAVKYHQQGTCIELMVLCKLRETIVICKNKICDRDENSYGLGLGLDNLRRRLDLQDQQTGQLKTEIQENSFVAILSYKH